MVKTVVCSTGTSAGKAIFKRVPKISLVQFIEEQGEVETAAESLFSEYRDTPPEGENLQKVLSAEIHSLVRIGINPKDRILLLASSTDDGYCCALAVEKYLKHYWEDITVETKQIQGLQVKDADLFRREGVVYFVKNILNEIETYGADNVVLNPTGGFKALVPYTVMVGMLKGVTCRYIFEQSTTLLELPPFPVEFIRSRFEYYRSVFEQIERETSISQEEWKKIPYADQAELKILVEEVENQVTLSAIGFLFLEEMRRPSKLVPFLSRPAVEEYLNLTKLSNRNPFDFLSRVARSNDALEQAKHINVGDGLYWLKPGRTTDRYLVSVEGWRLLVWRAIREDQVGGDYPNKVTVDTSDRQRYYPFMRMDGIFE